MDDNNSVSKDSGGSKEHGGENIHCLIEYLSHYKETVGRNMVVEVTSGQGSEEMKKMLLETGGKGILLYGGRKFSLNCVLQWKCGKKDL